MKYNHYLSNLSYTYYSLITFFPIVYCWLKSIFSVTFHSHSIYKLITWDVPGRMTI